MKEILKRYSLLMLALMFATACSSDDGEATAPAAPSVDGVEYEILSAEDFTAEELMTKLFADGSANLGAGIDASTLRTMFLDALGKRTRELEEALGVKGITLGYRRVKYLYNSTDHQGNPVKLSSVVYWNRYKLDGWHDVTPDNICLVEHYTITSDAEAPSNSYPLEAHITGNSVVVMPDYLGYGHTAERLHPYLNYDLAAVNSIDALKAAYTICCDHSPKMLLGSWSLSVLGASQGGSNALAVHKYLDTNPALAREWRFSHSYCAAGAYSLSQTIGTYLRWGELEYPVVLPLVLKSMIASYPEIMGAYSEEDFYSPEYNAIKPLVDAALADKKHTTTQINAIFFDHFGVDGKGKVLPRDILSAEAMDFSSPMMKALFACFEKNDLTKGWTPKHPVKFYHSKDDNVVPYENVEAAMAAFGKMATLQNAPAGTKHVESCAMWMFAVFMGGI